jgi:hypothetical protein
MTDPCFLAAAAGLNKFPAVFLGNAPLGSEIDPVA